MPISRRQFIASSTSLAAVVTAAGAAEQAGPATASGGARSTADPLGVRADFPIVKDRVYLNSAYITPVPRQVVARGRAFVERKAERPIPLGEMLQTTNEVRAQFAKLIHADADEIGFLFSTSEGENIVANALGLTEAAPVEVVRSVAWWVFAAFLPLALVGVGAAFTMARDPRHSPLPAGSP